MKTPGGGPAGSVTPGTRRAAAFLLLFAAALAPRLWIAAELREPPLADAAVYWDTAESLSVSGSYEYGGRPTALFPPAFPMFLAALKKAGAGYAGAMYWQAALGSAACLLAAALGWAAFGYRTGLTAGFLCAFYPPFLRLAMYLRSENLYLVLSLAAMLLWLEGMKRKEGRAPFYAASGFVLGLATLARSVGGFLFLAVAGYSGARALPARPRAGLAAVSLFVLCYCLALLPWTARNYKVFGAFIPAGSEGGLTFYSSWVPPVRDGVRIWGWVPQAEDKVAAAIQAAGNEAEAGRMFYRAAAREIVSNPARTVRLALEKVLFLYVHCGAEKDGAGAERARRVIDWWGLCLLPFAALGMVLVPWREGMALPLCAPLFSTLVSSVIFYASDRFRLAAEPVLAIFAAYALVSAAGFLRGRRAPGVADA